MTNEIPQFALRAYALFYLKHGTREAFKQSDLDWIVSSSMKKKIFSSLLKAGWLKKEKRPARWLRTGPWSSFEPRCYSVVKD